MHVIYIHHESKIDISVKPKPNFGVAMSITKLKALEGSSALEEVKGYLRAFHEFDLQIYKSATIDSIEWPDTPEGNSAKSEVVNLVKNGVDYYMDNIRAEVFAIKLGNLILPIAVPNEDYTNSYVCSPYAHYIIYGKEAVRLIDNSLLRSFIQGCLGLLDRYSRFGRINKVLYVNNSFFSTDLYPGTLSVEKIEKILHFLRNIFPQHAIVFRSINALTNPQLMQDLKTEDFLLIASRQVYITDTKQDWIFQTRILKSDLKLLRESPYAITDETELSSEERQRVLELYNLTYLSQHSPLFPQLNLRFIELSLQESLLHFQVLRIEGIICGVVGYLVQNGTLFSPLFGYDKNHPQHATIYRLLSTSLLLEAKKRGLVFHQSSGASFYKKVRRAEGVLEYMAVYVDHLPYYQRVFWRVLKYFINTLAPPYMRKY